MNLILGIYLAGAAVGLVATDARWPTRVSLALLWPIGPIAFVVTIAMLVVASFIGFPVVGLIAGILLAGALALVFT